MECNKDEAVRARQIAEARMQRGEFVEALRFATKAKKLYAEVENVNQILAICEVHNAAKEKLASGSELDWYAILQTQRLADEATIKKQYRRLALLLHPDKNKFAGAEAAFKLIGQANGVLSDQAKRSLYDKKIGVSVRFAAPQTSHHNANGVVFAAKSNANTTNSQKKFDSNVSSNGNVSGTKRGAKARNDQKKRNVQKKSGPKSTSSNNQAEKMTFWTACEHCNARYQYYMSAVNATLACQYCLKSFKAHVIRLGRVGVSPSTFTSGNIQKTAPMPGPPKPAPGNTGGKPLGGEHAGMSVPSNPQPMKKFADVVGGHRDGEKNKDGNVPVSQGKESQTFQNVKRKRVRQSTPGSKEDSEKGLEESFKARNGNETKDGNAGENDVYSLGVNTRRSSRTKEHVSYVENSGDEDSEILSKKPRQNGDGDVKKNGSSNNNNPVTSAAGVAESDIGLRTSKEEYCSPLKSSVRSGPEILQCPDADFNDFEKGKEEDCFAVNQLWAMYDTADAMPRFYALIKKVASPFNLHFTWLEPDPDGEGENDWYDADLPIACGKFILGKSEKTTDRTMFSHQMRCIKGSRKDSYLICPNKGETWAIFRDWDIKWSSNPEKHSEYEFDYVEILSDFAENGITVAYLGKVKGFVSLFQGTEKNGVHIFNVPPHELYRFSHQIPSYKMTGNERVDVPRGSFELDPAALATSLFEVGDSGRSSRGQ